MTFTNTTAQATVRNELSIARAIRGRRTKSALYIRTEFDEADGLGVELQRKELRHYADSYPYEIVREYVDRGFPATTRLAERHGGALLLADAARGDFDVVIVYRLDRLGCADSTLAADFHALVGLGVSILSVSEHHPMAM